MTGNKFKKCKDEIAAKKNAPRFHLNKGQILIQVIVFGAVAGYLIGAFANWAALNIKTARQTFERERALQIAEAGIDYYRWHLAHAPTDFQDGTGGPGPYAHIFRDKDGNSIGQFSLNITPPPVGSTLVTIQSTGSIDAAPGISRTITSRLAKPSFAKYAWVMNSEFVRFGTTAEVFGPIHSNTGIRFDGLAHNLITSAVAEFDDPDHTGANEFGVHTHGNGTDPGSDPLPPAAVPNRPLIFESGRQLPVPAVDFNGITVDLAAMKADAQASGVYLAASGALGYRVNLRIDDTVDVYRVNSVVASCGGVQTWSISGETFLQNYPNPANGVIFVEDHAWVSGQIASARITIASGKFPDNPATRTNIIANNDIRYTNYDGQDVLGLIAQGNFHVGLVSEDDLRVDAAIMAQNGYVRRLNYSSSSCGATRWRTLFTSYGMLGSNLRPAFLYSGSGYNNRVYNYDANLLYGPPPSFPLTSDQYVVLSWEEE